MDFLGGMKVQLCHFPQFEMHDLVPNLDVKHHLRCLTESGVTLIPSLKRNPPVVLNIDRDS